MGRSESSRRVSVLALAVAVLAAAVAPGRPATAAEDEPPPRLTVELPNGFSDLLVHPETGVLYVASGDSVHVLSPIGAPVAALPGLYGASGLVLHEDDLYVMETTAGRISRFSVTTLERTGSWEVRRPLGDSAAWAGGRLWFFTSGQYGSPAASTLDPSEGTIEHDRIPRLYAPLLRSRPVRPDELLIGERGLSPANIQRWDVAADPPVQLARTGHGTIGSNLRDYRMPALGDRLSVANGSPYHYPDIDPDTLVPTGLIYGGTHYPLAIAYSTHGLVHAGGSDASYGRDVYVHLTGVPTPIAAFELGGLLYPRGLGLSPSGTVLYAAHYATPGDPDRAATLSVIPLPPDLIPAPPEPSLPDWPLSALPELLQLLEDPVTDPTTIRCDGADRVATAVCVSRLTFADAGEDTGGERVAAAGVIVARADDFADALAGTVLAARRIAPLLLTGGHRLAPGTAAEIRRVLGSGGTVWVLGGANAISPTVDADVRSLGFDVERLEGADRFETAVAIARATTASPSAVFVTTGRNFADAVAAGPAAVASDSVVLLSDGDQPHRATEAYLADLHDVPVLAVGGPASRAHPTAVSLAGPTRVETALAVADLFPAPPAVGIARSDDFADALAGGAHIGGHGSPMLLTPPDRLPDTVKTWLAAHAASIDHVFVYGGETAISPDVAADVERALSAD